MKAINNNDKKKQKVKKKPVAKTKKEQVLVVAQEFKFARLLSGNEKKTRDRVLKALKKWLLNCFQKSYEFKEDDFIRVWKGLFYAVWMSDKPLIQEELCENIAGILDLFSKEQIKNAVLMTKAGLKVLATEWYGIDQHRMDKFLMLVRRYLRSSLRCLSRCDWSLESCNIYTKMLTSVDGILAFKTPLYARNSQSMILHFIDCFLEELAKVSRGKIPDESLVCLMRPFSALVCGGESLAVCNAAQKLLTDLLRQSELGLQYSEAEKAWQQMGCPPGGPEALELVAEEDDENETHDDVEADVDTQTSTVLDPRAGRVDVVLPLLPVPAALLAEDIRLLMQSTGCASKAFKRAKTCMQRFVRLQNNKYPLRIKNTDFLAKTEEPIPKLKVAAKRLRTLEKKLVASADELALRGLSRKHRKRLLAKTRAGLSIIEDVPTPPKTANDDLETEEHNDEQKKPKDTSNKENQLTKKKRSGKKRKLDQKNPNEAPSAKKIKPGKNVPIQEPKTRQAVNKLKNGVIENNANIKKIKNKKIGIKKDKVKENNKKIVTEPEKKHALVIKDNNKKITTIKDKGNEAKGIKKVKPSKASLVVNKVKNHKNQIPLRSANKAPSPKLSLSAQKKVKFVLKNNGTQGPVDYYKSVRQSPNIPFDSSKRPSKTNLKPSTPSPINPFFKKKLRMK